MYRTNPFSFYFLSQTDFSTRLCVLNIKKKTNPKWTFKPETQIYVSFFWPSVLYAHLVKKSEKDHTIVYFRNAGFYSHSTEGGSTKMTLVAC